MIFVLFSLSMMWGRFHQRWGLKWWVSFKGCSTKTNESTCQNRAFAASIGVKEPVIQHIFYFLCRHVFTANQLKWFLVHYHCCLTPSWSLVLVVHTSIHQLHQISCLKTDLFAVFFQVNWTKWHLVTYITSSISLNLTSHYGQVNKHRQFHQFEFDIPLCSHVNKHRQFHQFEFDIPLLSSE